MSIQNTGRNRWNKQDITYLRRHAQDGATGLANHFGVSVSAVRTLASRNGISLTTRTFTAPLCVECRNAPVYTASKEAAARELCEVCYLKWQVAAHKDEVELLKLRKQERSLAAQRSTLRAL
jgi:hypothetical protein